MKNRRSILQRLTDSTDLPGAPIPSQPVVEIAGDRRVLIENHFGVKEYGHERICVQVKFGILQICGCGLELSRMTKEQLVISGRIDGIVLVRRGRQ